MNIKATEIRSGDTIIRDDFTALVINVRRLVVCGVPQIVHIILSNPDGHNPGSLLLDSESMVKIKH